MTFSESINDLFAREEWAKARQLLEERLQEEPNNHWLLTRLGTTYYEQENYKKALAFSQKAQKLAPSCPLVLWDLASTREMLGDDLGAVDVYTKLFRMGVKGVGEEECGEGLAWAQSLLTDCLYSVAGCLHRLGRQGEALWFIRQHLEFRALGAKSIYPLKSARARLRQIAGAPSGVFERELGEAGKRLAHV